MKIKKILSFILAILLLLPIFATEKGKVYLVMGSDTAIWEGLGLSGYDGRYFRSGLYSDPERWAYGVMDSTFRNPMKDSFGRPMKMTWWMMAGNVFHLSKNCNIPIRNSITLYLMKKYHQEAINRYDDQLTLHYHNYYWSDTNGDGIYYYNQGLDFRLNQADYEECLSKFLIEDDVFPISFRAGWHYMDNYWQAYQERFIPFDMSNAYPAHGGDYNEPTNNIIDWSQSPDAFVPYHPNADNYQIEGDLKQWRLRSIMFGINNRIPESLETMFQEAANGNDQMCCFWSHLPQDDFLPAMQYLHEQADTLSKQYGVEFMYAKDVEAMRLWIDPEDTIAPILTVNEILDGDNIRFAIETDGPIFQVAEPFITVKTKYETYERLDCSITGENQWETIKAIPADDLAKVSVAVCDTVGNQAKVHLDYVPDDIFIDDQSAKFVEGAGDWSDYAGDCELWDLNARVLNGRGDVKIIYDNIEPESLTLEKSFVPSRRAIPCAIYFHGPGSTSDSIRVITESEIQKDTIIIDKELLGRDKWQFVGFYDDISILSNEIIFENLDSNSNLGIDVVRITPLIADKNFIMETDMINFGEVSVKDTATFYLTLSNLGKEELTISKFSVFGSNLELGETAPFILAPMEVKEIPLKFYTDNFCEYSDVLTIETDDPRNPYKLIPVFANATSYYRLVDNDDAEGYMEGGSGWFTSVATAWLGTSRCVYINGRGNYADFSKELKFSGTYEIQFIVPKTVNAHNHADYIIMIEGVPLDTVVVDQNTNSGEFVSIGEYDFPQNQEITLRIQDNGGNTNPGSVLRADAVKFILIEEKFVSTIDHAGIPDEFKLFQNYPNPFNPSTQIYFALPEASEVTIDFFDLQGKKVDTGIKQNMEAGYHHINWSPEGLSSGVYIYRVMSPVGMAINKCTFIK
ncbi:MAG: T9SS type A sorting domain-containing protein [Candidatus Marinimicrobia bacterium]|nr:T9SS type A sorting domain-containing protein [Candidatus Neomarinimicrobiota bacterium]